MRRWFDLLSLHGKLVMLALVVSTVALMVALLGTTAFDALRFRRAAAGDAATLARIVAENSAAAVAFMDRGAAEEILSSVSVRAEVTRACLYLNDGTLFAHYERTRGMSCPGAPPESPPARHAGASSPIVRNSQTWGWVYVERDLSDLAARLGTVGVVATLMLLAGGTLAFFLARRLARTISTPLTRLAAAAGRVDGEGGFPNLDIPATQDEVGDLVAAFQAMLARVRDANQGLLREIEERKNIEAERERLLASERETNRKKDEFVATVSHELRTPLGVVLTWAQILEETTPDDVTLAKALAAISRSTGEQARIIDDLVDVSRLATGKLHIHREPIDLRGPVETSVDVARPQAETKAIRLDMEMPDTPCPINGDRDRLRQMVGNLLSNALKFTETGGRVSVTLREVGSTYEIDVTDDGKGIAPDVLPQVFERFWQADGSLTRRYSGLGLGLAIVKEVVELHGGSVVARSPGPGLGTSFRVRLPKLVEAALEEDGQPGLGPVRERLDGVSVLTVDDNPQALEAMAIALQAAGADVRTATSGADALSSWERDPPDVLLCDLAMPDMDGFLVLTRIRGRDGCPPSGMPAIAVSAHATAEHRERSLAAGFAEHISKPYKIPDLIRAVRRALEADKDG